MPKVIVKVEVEDVAKWEEGFRTHGELFREQTVNKPIHFTEAGKNEILICFEPDDLDTYLRILDSAETETAMKVDGVKRETVQVFVLDKEFDPR